VWLVVGLMLVVVAAPVVSASTHRAESITRCSGHTYRLIDPAAFPGVYRLTAINLPALTDGYAPRCLVAEDVASQVQYKVGRLHRYPAAVIAMGARWYSGTWRITYRFRYFPGPTKVAGSKFMTARRGNQTITAWLTS
jgi:hypothetical protein